MGLKKYRVAVVFEFKERDMTLESLKNEIVEMLQCEIGYTMDDTKIITLEVEELDYPDIKLEDITP